MKFREEWNSAPAVRLTSALPGLQHDIAVEQAVITRLRPTDTITFRIIGLKDFDEGYHGAVYVQVR